MAGDTNTGNKLPQWFPLEVELTREQIALAVKAATLALSGGPFVRVQLRGRDKQLRMEVWHQEQAESS